MQRRYWLTDITPAEAFSLNQLNPSCDDQIGVDVKAFEVALIIDGAMTRAELKTIMDIEFVNSSGQVLMFQRMYIDTKEQLTLFYCVPFVSDATPSACVIAQMQENTETLNRLAA